MYIVNGILMLLVFFLFRVAMFPVVYLWYADNVQLDLVPALATIPLKCHLVTASVWCPQLYWFYKMVVGARKLIQSNNNNAKSKYK